MPFNLRDDPARLRPAFGLIGEIGATFVWRSSNRPREQMADLLLQHAVGGKPDRMFDPLGFEKLVNFGVSETRVGSEIDARYVAPIARHNRVQDAFPAIGAVNARRVAHSAPDRQTIIGNGKIAPPQGIAGFGFGR
jgi:hypothetical protein